MAISPFIPGTYRAASNARTLTEMRSMMDDLQRQLTTEKKSETHGGLGTQRFTSLQFRAKLSSVDSFMDTIKFSNIRLSQMDLGLKQLTSISSEVRTSTINPQYELGSTGQSQMQKYATERFREALDVLNLNADGVYYFAGRKSDTRPVLDLETIVNGDAAGRAGVRQMITERKAADAGIAGSLGRVTRGGVGTNATLTEDGTHPFGFKLTAASSTTADIAAVRTAGPPANVAFNVLVNPAPGSEVRVELTLPGGSTQVVSLTAFDPLAPAPANQGSFAIGATPAATAANLRTALSAALDTQATTTLPAASALAASNAFFAGNEQTPPQRIPVPNSTATAFVPGTPADTVIWYRGDATSTNARATAQARIDTDITVNVGAQANELGIRRMLASLAVFTTETFSTANAADKARHEAMANLLRAELSDSSSQTVADIHLEVGIAQATLKRADDRHKATKAFVEDVIGGVENVSKEEAAAKLLSMQTKMQAAYQTTSILSRLSLTDYLR